MSDNIAEGAQEYDPCASVEPEEHKRNENFNPRESLDWDSAFFTSAGLLDPEELSDIIERADSGRKQKHFLPGVQEELSGSTDSISSFGSDSLESLEADLFCYVRASIQRSSKASGLLQVSNVNKRHGNVGTKSGCASKTIALPSANTPKPKLALKKLSSGTQGLGKTMKLGSHGAQVNKAAVQSRESMSSLHRPPLAAAKAGSQIAAPVKRMSISSSRIKTDSGAVGVKGMIAIQSRESMSSLHRPPLAAGRAGSQIAAPIKRMSISSSRIKTDSGAAVVKGRASSIVKVPNTRDSAAGKAGSQIAARMSISSSRIKTDSGVAGVKGRASSIVKVPNTRDSGSAMPASAKSLGPPALKKTGRSSTCSSYDSSSSCLSETSCASTLNGVKRKVDKTGKLRSSASNLKMPSRVSLNDSSSSCSSEASRASILNGIKRKVDKTATLPSSGSNLKAPSRVSLKGKPQSGSSQLLAYLNSTPKLSTSTLPASSISELSTESSVSTATVNQKPIDRTSSSDTDAAPRMQVHHGDEASALKTKSLAGHINQPAKQTSAGNGSLPRSVSAKPSGLRLPSPKIGFYDGAKTGGQAPSGSFQSRSGLSSFLAKSGAQVSTKRKVDKTATLPSSGSNLKAPSRFSLKGKPQSGSSQLLAYLQSTPKLSTGTSPASSISELSTESSVSTATVNQKPIDMTSSSDTDAAPRMQVHHGDDASALKTKSLAGHINQPAKQTSAGNGSLPHSVSAKPSGLRLPLPKIGFFDGAKTGGRTPGGSFQSHSGLSSFLAKSGAQISTPSPCTNKSRPGTIIPKPAATNATSAAHSKVGMQMKDSMTKRVDHPQKGSRFSEKSASVCSTNYCTKTPEEVNSRSSPNLDFEVVREVKHVADPGSGKLKEANLNQILNRYGPLATSETEFVRNSKVFKRRADADAAFSSSGKFQIFGPSLVSYGVNYDPVMGKTKSPVKKQCKKGAKVMKDGTTA